MATYEQDLGRLGRLVQTIPDMTMAAGWEALRKVERYYNKSPRALTEDEALDGILFGANTSFERLKITTKADAFAALAWCEKALPGGHRLAPKMFRRAVARLRD